MKPFLRLCPLLLTVACGNSELTPESITEKIALTRLQSCPEVERYIEDRFIEDMARHFDALRQNGGFGWPEAGFDDRVGAPTNGGGEQGGPGEFTDTNTREAGVDEADFVKTDGVRTFVLAGKKLYATQSWPAHELRVVDSLPIDGYPREMFLVDDIVVVFSDDWIEYDGTIPGEGAEDVALPCEEGRCGYHGRPISRITIIDASGPELAIQREVQLNGHYQTSRRIDDAIRIVGTEPIYGPQDLRYWPEGDFDPSRNRGRWLEALAQLELENVAKIRARSLSEFLPHSTVIDPLGNETVLPQECARFHRPNAAVPLGLSSVWTLNLDLNTLDRTSVFGQASLTYASEDTLYIASPHHWWLPRDGDSTHTYVHAFDLTLATRTVYRGSFGIPGHVLDPYSIDEYEDHVRVATHVLRFRHSEARWQAPELFNRVTVLRRDPFGFTRTGRTPDLAPNEQIFSARLDGDRGFLVTFERVDPLFTLDLSDPTNPRVIGELKVPGFSTYIHPLGPDHLLTIGEHIPDPAAPDNFPRGLKLSVFDVSDFAQPTELHVAYLGEGYSEASWDPKAFTYFQTQNTLAIPISRWGRGWESFRSELQLFEIDLHDGISSRGAIDVRDLYPHPEEEPDWAYSPTVRRGLMADEFAYAISDAGIKAARIDSPETTVGSCLFR
ncbi:MAG: beta-propeller domain-containing protein [Myxococcota bacterium]